MALAERKTAAWHMYAAVGGFGVLGAWSRYFISILANGRYVSDFPWGTLLCNIAGSYVLAKILLGGALPLANKPWLRIGLTTGFLGSFTTFSAFSVETVSLLTEQHYALAAAYAGLSLAGGMAAARMGARRGRAAGGAS
ncbi:fluoride efflux transporter FluC [Paenibacillus turpanensis]|uniref:fluoride efflux transporter FluC n=1 Tax=Paenibacillus turpanensis TaxID=2689078 RepID=UPI001FB7D3A3|nr:CrcB family protein [Paenibacillus turpanensis]